MLCCIEEGVLPGKYDGERERELILRTWHLEVAIATGPGSLRRLSRQVRGFIKEGRLAV